MPVRYWGNYGLTRKQVILMSTEIIVVIVVAVIVDAALVTRVLRLFPDCETMPTLLTSRAGLGWAGLVPVMALAQRAGLMVTPAVRFASGEPARAAGVTATLAEAAMGSGWHCTRADSLGGRSECGERPTR
jgi:hypothetical protein